MKNEISFAECKVQLFRLDFDENLAEISDVLQIMLEFEEKYRQFAKFPEISAKIWKKLKKVELVNIFIFHVIISFVS